MTTLTEVKHYMQSRRRASVTDIAIGLSTTPDNARALLEMWRAKDRVRFIPAACGSGSCGKGPLGGCSCSASAFSSDVYEWLGEGEGRVREV